MQKKLDGDQKTKLMQVTIMRNSTIVTGAHCRITAVGTRRISRRV